MILIYGYIRVSTDHQNTENQKFEIQKFCEKESIVIDKWIEETISSTRDLKKENWAG
jgi:DNA invertase Pin-like site-specific DNA recombinase